MLKQYYMIASAFIFIVLGIGSWQAKNKTEDKGEKENIENNLGENKNE